MSKKFYITTAIPYINAPLHIGFAMELIQADVLARYNRQNGADTFFLTGSDENALKNVRAAEKMNLDIKIFIDQHVQKFQKLTKVLNISNDDFIRTTEERHIKSAQKFWHLCDSNGDIYKKNYKGLYCIGCEEFKTDKDLVDRKCPEHGIKPETVEEENYFFRLSKYQKNLEELIDSGKLKIIPDSRKNEAREFIRQGLEDFSISRSNVRAKNWGIQVPGDSSQRIFVWFDALVNYLSALDFAEDEELFKKYWQENEQRCHLIGKGINRFHTIYWPAMLLSAGIKPPSTIYIHGYVNIDGEKISKSLGNTIDPFKVIEKYGAEVVRYFLLREIPSGDDGDFSYKKLEERYNGDLANGLGNLVQRVVTLIDDKMDGELIYESEKCKVKNVKLDNYRKAMEEFKLHEALGEAWKLIAEANQYIDERKPWIEVKESPEKFLETMANLLFSIRRIAWMLLPFMPETAEKIFETFGDDKSYPLPEDYKFIVKKGGVLFPRL